MSDVLIQIALSTFGVDKTGLARKFDLPLDQLNSKLSSENEQILREKLDLGDLEPDFVLATGSIQNAMKWDKLIRHLASVAIMLSETGYSSDFLSDEVDFLGLRIVEVFSDLGMTFPGIFPECLDFDYDLDTDDLEDDDEDDDNSSTRDSLFDNIDMSPHASLILEILQSFLDIEAYHTAYIYNTLVDLANDAGEYDRLLLFDDQFFQLAASKLEIDVDLAPLFPEMKRDVIDHYSDQILEIKSLCYKHRIPIAVELYDLVSKSHEYLSHEAEREALGFNRPTGHPDFYMKQFINQVDIIDKKLSFIIHHLKLTRDDFGQFLNEHCD